jgi:sigma-B regulation protein RsbU (phosphoserine phosphatase)
MRISGRCIQRGRVGGDVYDVQLLPDEQIAILVADLSGHDVAAALNTAMLRSIVWREAEQAKSPGEVLARLNEQLCEDLPDEHFASAVFCWFDLAAGQLHYANAGHPSSYLGATSIAWQELESVGPVLGLISGAEYPTLVLEVPPGARLFLYSDGVPETRNPQGQLWGTEKLRAMLDLTRSEEPERVVGMILDELLRYRSGKAQEDDLTLMVADLPRPAAKPQVDET